MSKMVYDHSHNLGKGGKKGSVFPMETSVKEFKSAEGAGTIKDYPDTDEMIKDMQEKSISMAKAQAQKPGFRN